MGKTYSGSPNDTEFHGDPLRGCTFQLAPLDICIRFDAIRNHVAIIIWLLLRLVEEQLVCGSS